MANDNTLWFEMGVRDEVSKAIKAAIQLAAQLGAALDEATLMKQGIANAENLERAYDKIAVAVDRINEAKSKTNDRDELRRLRDMEKEVNKMLADFKKLEKSSKIWSEEGSTAFEKLYQGFQLAMEQITRYTNEIDQEAKVDAKNKAAEEKRIDSLKNKYNELYRTRRELQDAVMNASPDADTTEAIKMINKLASGMSAVTGAQRRGSGMPASVQGADYEEFLRRVKEQIISLSGATSDYNHRLRDNETIQKNLQRLSGDTESQKKIAHIKKQIVEYNALAQKLIEIKALEREVNQENADLASGKITTPKLTRDVVNQRLDAIQRRYNEAVAQGRQREREDIEAKNQKTAAAKRTADAIQMLSHVNQGLVSSYNRIAEAGSRANRITIQLQNQVAGYAGLYGLERIIKSIITIGGQFEFQHIALQNILGDLQQANTLFAQLQEMAVESPKTFMELTAYTKQLSAYQIPYEELFDTTKRLADISTGLGVDMSRLILAYGQVRSAAVLRGQELRQFTEAGIPLVQKLAEKFSDLNGKAVTTGEVFELISKRAVPFKMVKEILFDMTDEGGQFFDMQSKLADTLYGKYQKLQDSWQIMLGRIADGEHVMGKIFKVGIEGVVGLINSLDTLMPALSWLMAGRLIRGGANSISTFFDNASGLTAIKRMELSMQENIARLERERIQYGRQLNAEEQALVNSGGKLRSQEYYLLGIEKQISAQKAYQLMMDGKMEKSHFYKMLQMQGYTREQRKQIANGEIQILQQSQNRGNAILNFMGGWVGVAMTSIGVILSLYQRVGQQAERAAQVSESATNSMLKDLESVNNLYNELSRKKPVSGEDKTSAITRMTNTLKESGNYSTELQKQVEATDNLTDKYRILFGELQKIANEYLLMKDNVRAYLDEANRAGEGNWFTKLFNDNMTEDLSDWSKKNIAVNVAKKGVDRFGAAIRAELERELKQIGKWVESEMRDQTWQELFYNNNLPMSQSSNLVYTNVGEEAYKALHKYMQALGELNTAEKEVNSQLNDYVDYISVAVEETMKMQGLDMSKMTEWSADDLRKFDNSINDIIGSYTLDGKTAAEFKEKIYNALLPEPIRVKIRTMPDVEESDLAPWQKNVQQYFEDHKLNNNVIVNIDAQSSLEKVEKDLQTKRKEWQEQMDRSGAILVKFGFDLSSLPTDIDAAISKLPVMMQDYVRKAFSDFLEGKSGTSTADQAGKDLGLKAIKPKKTTSGGSNEDKQLKKAKERLDFIKKFYAEYKKYREVYGESKGQSFVEDIFGMKAGEGNAIIKNYKDEIKKVFDIIGNKFGTEERKKFRTAVNQLIGDINLDDAKQGAKKAVDTIKEELQRQSEQWNLYKELLSKTGNKEFANAAFADGKVWNDQARALAEKLYKTMYETVNEDGVMKINWDLDEKTTEEYFKSNFKNGEALFDIWKDIVKLLRGNYQTGLKESADAMSSLLTYDEKILKVEQEIADLRKQGAAENDPRIIKKKKELEQVQAEAFEHSSDYLRFYEAILSMTIPEAEAIGQKIKENLNREMQRGTKSANQYLKVIKNIDEQMKKLRESKSGLSSFITGGLQGYVNDLYDKAESEYSDALIKEQKAYEDMRTAERTGDYAGYQQALNAQKAAESMKEGAASAMQGAQGAMSTVSVIDKIIHGIDGAVQGIKGTFDEIKEMYDALGYDTNSGGWQSTGTFLSAFSAASSSATKGWDSLKNGDIGGAIQGVVGSVTNWFTGIAKGWDNKMDHQIEIAQQQLNATKRLKESVEKTLDRTLGGVYGFKATKESIDKLTEARNRTEEIDEDTYSERAKNSVKSGFKNSAIGGAIGSFLGPVGAIAGTIIGGLLGNIFGAGTKTYTVNYYSDDTRKAMDDAIQSQTYYDEQLALLYKERDELYHQLESEQDKKDSDAEKIEDYKASIEEVKDSIKNFALDMAKALWDIDIKGWASSLTDAVVNAWKNGENAVEAYRNKVKEMMLDLTTNILSQKVMEKALERINLDNLISEIMDTNDGMLNEESVVMLADRLNMAAEAGSEAITTILDKLEARGYISKGDESGTSSSGTSIKSITENTADLLAGYINAIRADVSVNRITLMQILDAIQSNGGSSVVANAQLEQLKAIAANTAKNAEAAQMIYDLLHKVTPDGTRIQVR